MIPSPRICAVQQPCPEPLFLCLQNLNAISLPSILTCGILKHCFQILIIIFIIDNVHMIADFKCVLLLGFNKCAHSCDHDAYENTKYLH